MNSPPPHATPADRLSLAVAAAGVLNTADARAKAAASRSAAAAWRSGAIAAIGSPGAPDRPARPARPELRTPRDMPKRRGAGTRESRIALLHALAHIELNAIDLAWDIVGRFASPDLPSEFFDDWVGVADDEARHFELLSARLAAFGAAYGDLPAHDGLWQAALETRHDLLARLAIVPLVLEARGLDVTPGMIARFERMNDPAFGDAASAAALTIIYRDEIAHVAAGRRWFEWECARRGVEPVATWRALLTRYFNGALKPPFNDAARAEAGFPDGYYAFAR